MKRKSTVFILLFIAILFPAAQPAQASAYRAPQAAGSPALIEFQQVATGLSLPVDIAHAGDGTNRLFIVQQGGRILIHDGTQLLAAPFLNITSLVTSGGERGLLGIAFHPNYESNGYFYVNYTRTVSNQLQTVIARYHVSADPNVADSSSESILLIIDQDFDNHNGGQIHFGPDGYLYIGMGDGGDGGDPNNRAQNPTSLLGKMLRIDVDSGSPYAIPPSNPFVSNASVADEIWAFGLRNPWRFSFDRLTGDLFIADVGQNAWEEVNIQPASSTGGENYGWSCDEGNHDYNNSRDCTIYGVLTNPKLEYEHGPGDSIGCSVTGGYIYRGTKYPAMDGVYFYGDFCTGRLWAASQNASVWTSSLVADTDFLISAFGEDEAGELYLASYGDGVIYHMTASSFADVPTSYWSWDYVERLYESGITGGCSTSPLSYCPTSSVTRAQMAVFLLKGIHGSSYTPPAVGNDTGFSDVATDYWAAAWIKQLAAEAITSGCGSGVFCPDDSVTRAQMAVFLLKAKHGSSYTPPDVSATFSDTSGHWAEDWIEQLAVEAITGGCAVALYCPENPVTRDQMAVFLVKAFNLP
ncbi:MAG: PQQ-dependent sugar dehydrogenase [Anaerolineales bacterium]|nr:PQQ-dependent sugar dehydrogenase [Anaerolineales bacterium]